MPSYRPEMSQDEDWISEQVDAIISQEPREAIIRQHQRAIHLMNAMEGSGIMKAKMDIHNKWWVYEPTSVNSGEITQRHSASGKSFHTQGPSFLTEVSIAFPSTLHETQVWSIEGHEFEMMFEVVNQSPRDPVIR